MLLYVCGKPIYVKGNNLCRDEDDQKTNFHHSQRVTLITVLGQSDISIAFVAAGKLQAECLC